VVEKKLKVLKNVVEWRKGATRDFNLNSGLASAASQRKEPSKLE